MKIENISHTSLKIGILLKCHKVRKHTRGGEVGQIRDKAVWCTMVEKVKSNFSSRNKQGIGAGRGFKVAEEGPGLTFFI